MTYQQAFDTSTNALPDALEGLIDAHGLSRVLNALAQVCDEKAEHVLTNWQDKRGSANWTLAGQRIDRVAAQLPNFA